MPQNAFFLQTHDLLVSQRHFFPTLHPFSMVIFATATVLALVLLHDSRFNFHCYTQHEATPTQKSASCNFLCERYKARSFWQTSSAESPSKDVHSNEVWMKSGPLMLMMMHCHIGMTVHQVWLGRLSG